MISIIAAMSQNNVIGKDNKLPWHIPEDLKFFKSITSGHPVIMGRKTFESLKGPLPNRRNIVLTRDKAYNKDGLITYTCLEEAIGDYYKGSPFIIGGEQIYKYAIEKDLIDRIYLTIVFRDFKGDTFFPDLDTKRWKKTSSTLVKKSKDQGLPYAFYIFERF